MKPFIHTVQSRKSVRNYSSQVPERKILEQVMEAARLAPSAVNFQPWQFLVVASPELLAKVHDCYHREWINTSPVCIVVLGNHNESWHRKADNKDHCDIDVSIAIDHLTLQAAELGLGTCWVCNFDVDKVVDLFELSPKMEPIALIPIGYPVESETLNPLDKQRKSLDEIVKWL